MSKVIEEAEKYSRLHKNNSEIKMFEPLRLISELTSELESKNKENTELKESLEKHSIFKAVSKIKKAEGDLEAHRKAFLKDSENSNKIIYNQQSDIESKNKENTDLRDLNTQLSREYDQMVVDWNAAREVVKEQQKEIERYKAAITQDQRAKE